MMKREIIQKRLESAKQMRDHWSKEQVVVSTSGAFSPDERERMCKKAHSRVVIADRKVRRYEIMLMRD